MKISNLPAGTAPALSKITRIPPPKKRISDTRLNEWLEKVKLTRHKDNVKTWCEKWEIVQIDEILESWELFADDLDLGIFERNRLSKAC